MATARPRTGRALVKDDANEERDLWKGMLADGKKVDALVAKMNTASQKIMDVEDQQATALARNDIPSAALDTELESLYRTTLKHTEEALHILETKNESPSIIAALGVLAALRAASESDPHHGANASAPMSRSSSTAKPARDRKRKFDASTAANSTSNAPSSGSAIADDNEGKSPAPANVGISPKVATGVSKLASTHKDKRSGSVPSSTRDGSVSVKLEDVGDSSSLDGSAVKEPVSSTSTTTPGPANPLITPSANRPQKLHVGAEVFFRNKARNAEGSGILCTITSINGEGKQRRYEIQDTDPEPDPTTGQIPPPTKASVQYLIPIPPPPGVEEEAGTSSAKGASPLEKGKQVLALYPNTTTFYKAEVSREWKVGGGDSGGTVRLRFEGEDEIEKEMDVERRYVLTEGLK
ncbi:hypothetical protein EV356DRAFT_535238 [Viridothelium virens]|uniref:SGF29 C-terminal domain-containing protein n=1 Tax=Viridothelium virens TaxID=1048519 RepID=A0A6A6H1H1_VIRVR|nr:hypothetical protein EV356DRAFT_535238 [Viridothelium virens]